MNTTNFTNLKNIIVRLLVTFMLLVAFMGYSQETIPEQDSIVPGYNAGKIVLKNPSSIISKYTYDPITDLYVYRQKVGEFNINYPLFLTPTEYQKLVQQEQLKAYYKQKIDAVEGKKEGAEEEQKNLLPAFYVNSGFFETIFGGNTIEVIPQGSVEVDLGVLFTQQDNPNFSPQNRSNFTFDFNQRISLSLLGKVGTRLQVTANYDTQSTFDFQNIIKLEYTPTEDDIVRKIEVGNVSMPLNSSLIRGAQSLFGVKTELQFGKTRVTAVFSEQQSQSTSVVAQGGGTLEEFEFFAQAYDENRHYFLSQFFRNNYDQAMLRYPFINNNIQITRAEVWVTNRNNQTQNVRNVVAFQDLGESEIIGLPSVPPGFVNVGQGAFPDNGNNDFNPENIGGPGSLLTPLVRDITATENGVLVPINEGFDYGKLENARKLNEGSEYFLNTRLGYISLNQRLLNDEVLAVAFQFTVGGEVFQVGEFANDGVNASDVQNNANDTQNITNNSLILKMLKSAVTAVDQPIWDLMMKNVYDTGAFQLEREDFRLNIFYTEASPVNFIRPVEGTTFPSFNNNTPNNPDDDTVISETPLIRLFHLDRLNFNNDPQEGGDGFFDYVEGLTVLSQNGKIIFTKVEPFGKYLFDVLDDDGNPGNNQTDYDFNNFNTNQQKYVYDVLYKSTKTAALDEADKNKFQIKGRFQSSGGGGIPLGAFNVPRGSVLVTAGGRTLVEGIDYTVDYQLGRVNIIDEALKASNTPINVSVENNAVFGQQTRRFAGVNVEHQFNDKFLLGATFLNLTERPITQKADFNSESVSNTMFGFNGNYSSEVPFLTRLANKLPNIDTDVPSNISLRGEFAFLAPGAPKGNNFDGESTSYIDDFEGTQGAIDLKSPLSWNLSSRPVNLFGTTVNDQNGLSNGFGRAILNWYTIDPIFYGSQRPGGVTNDDVSNLYTRRVFIEEIFPNIDIVQGQTSVINTLDLTYYPTERGPYNFDPQAANNTPLNPNQSWAGISRAITTTDFEQANVEFIEFWVQDPFLDNPASQGGKLTINLGNISEDILKDGKKQYENGLPENGDISFLQGNLSVTNPYVVPQSQSLIYTFSSTGQDRVNQDVGYDGYNDQEEQQMLNTLGIAGDFGSDPSNDNYQFYLNAEGNIFERYKRFNGVEGNSPDEFSNTNRGAAPQPDAEDINRDNTMNTIDSYFEYEIPITPTSLANPNNIQINDVKTRNITLPNGDNRDVTWYQFRIPISEATNAVGGITDIRSIRFARLYLTEFSEVTTLRFATLDLVRSDWRRFRLSLDDEPNNDNDNTTLNVGVIGIEENDGTYVSPPGVVRERLNNNNTIVRQNEQSLVVEVCELEPEDSRGIYKSVRVDMRQYNKLRMFIHARNGDVGMLASGDMVAFIRMGNDFTDNYYQVELPLEINNGSSPEDIWANQINLELSNLEQIKSLGIAAGTLGNIEPTWYDVTPNGLVEVNQFDPHTLGQQRIAIKGNPNFGDIRVLMLGLKNPGQNGMNTCGKAWFNELRLSDLDSDGGWAGILSVDSNIADFANVSATGRRSTAGFGSIEQKPNERSREDIKQYDVVTNLNLGQLLPKKWGIQLPFNYAIAEETITPEYDQFYRDIKLDTQLETTNNRDSILNVNESYTKRESINFIGVRKNRTTEATPRFYDVENLTLNYSYNKVQFRDFEIESSLDQNVRAGINYNFSFNPIKIEPFKKNDSIFKSRYFKILKDFNFNLLPTNFSFNTDFIRQFSKQKFREVELGGSNIGIEELFRRNYNFNLQYALNYNITDALNLNFTASNSNIVRNYFIDDRINGRQDPNLDIWDGFFDLGDPNIQNQQLQLNYELPFYKIPTLGFLRSTYAYTGSFQWQKGSDINSNLEVENPDGSFSNFDLGNSIQNSNTHNLNTTFNMDALYKYLGLVKKTPRNSRQTNRLSQPGVPQTSRVGQDRQAQPVEEKSSALANTAIDIVTMVKRVQINYSENNGTFLPGYLQTPGTIGTLKPTFGYTLGSQRDIRQLAARNGWLTVFPDFNQQYTEVTTKNLNYSASVQPLSDLTIDVTGDRLYAENNAENFRVEDINGDGALQFNSLIRNTFGNFRISTVMIGTAFKKSDEFGSEAFETFRENRLIVANRLAREFYGTDTFATDADGFPLGFSKNSQRVVLPAFLSAYQDSNPDKISLSAFRDFPIPNWNIKYTGLMRIKWFKDNFRRFSINHGYRSAYTINQFRANLDFVAAQPGVEFSDQNIETLNQSGDFKNETLLSNINLEESFSPLIRVDFEMKNSVKVLAEVKRDRILSLSFDNNLLTEIQGQEYTLGLGYRIKDVPIRSKIAGPQQIVKSDLNMRADISVRDNETIIRPLDITSTQVTAGQTIWNLKYTADYAFSRFLTAIFYFDYAFSDFAISTAFPQTSIRTGFTLRYNFGN